MTDDTLTVFLCQTCGTSFSPAAAPPDACPICEDDRQFVPPSGQGWTTLPELHVGYRNTWERPEENLFVIQTEPDFGIGQRCFLARTPGGNVLWDCIALLDDATIGIIEGLGGLAAIAISHPHYYTTCQDWAEAFDCPVWLHGDDWEWLMRPSPRIRFWEGERYDLIDDVTLLRLGGHFPGANVLLWSGGADGRGVLLSGDLPQVTSSADHVSFMYSYPNYLPLPAGQVQTIAQKLASERFERIYGAFQDANVMSDGGETVARSAAQYVRLLRQQAPNGPDGNGG